MKSLLILSGILGFTGLGLLLQINPTPAENYGLPYWLVAGVVTPLAGVIVYLNSLYQKQTHKTEAILHQYVKSLQGMLDDSTLKKQELQKDLMESKVRTAQIIAEATAKADTIIKAINQILEYIQKNKG